MIRTIDGADSVAEGGPTGGPNAYVCTAPFAGCATILIRDNHPYMMYRDIDFSTNGVQRGFLVVPMMSDLDIA